MNSSPAADVSAHHGPAKPKRVVHVLREDPALAQHLDPAHAETAEQLARARAITLSKGEFRPGDSFPREPGTLGFLVLDGLFLRGVSVANRPTLELFGAGDLVRPFDDEPDPYAMVPAAVRWWGLRPSSLAVLDDGFIRRISAYPELLAELAGRIPRGSGCVRLSIVQQPSLSTRVYLTLWHLADRFGTVQSDGIVLPVPLCQTLLSWLVGASRPATCRAVKALEGDGRIARYPDGTWWLGRQHPERVAESTLGARRVAA